MQILQPTASSGDFIDNEDSDMATWTTKDIPDQSGKLAVVTGATGGLGLETALDLAGAGAEVILVGRNPAKGRATLSLIKGRYRERRPAVRTGRPGRSGLGQGLHRPRCWPRAGRSTS
jgi:hypothetical protein